MGGSGAARILFQESGKELALTAQTLQDVAGTRVVWTGAFLVEKSDRYAVELLGPTGLRNPNPGTYPVVSVPDFAPVGTLLSPPDDTLNVVLPNAILPLRAEVRDDFGFARVDAETRSRWDALVGGYLARRRLLAGVVLVMDARRPLADADETLLAWLAARADAERLRVHLLLNKPDQIGRGERAGTVRRAEHRAESLLMPVSVQLFSGLNREGLDELRTTLSQVVEG